MYTLLHIKSGLIFWIWACFNTETEIKATKVGLKGHFPRFLNWSPWFSGSSHMCLSRHEGRFCVYFFFCHRQVQPPVLIPKFPAY